jgi:hypothetical protein
VSASSKLTEGELGMPHELKTANWNLAIPGIGIKFQEYTWHQNHHWHMTLSDVGGLANAAFWMIGLDPAKDLLHNFSPTMDLFWFHFVHHVNGVIHK